MVSGQPVHVSATMIDRLLKQLCTVKARTSFLCRLSIYRVHTCTRLRVDIISERKALFFIYYSTTWHKHYIDFHKIPGTWPEQGYK